MAYWNPIEFIFLFCDFIAPCKMRVGFCDVDIYGTMCRKSLLLETLLLCYFCCCYSRHCCWYCYLSMPSRKILKTEKCQYCFVVNNATWKSLSRELKADCWSIFYPDACVVLYGVVNWWTCLRNVLSHRTKGEATAQGAFERGPHLQLQLSPTTSSHDPLHQKIPISGRTD